jgi:hypothetical protein
MDYPQLPNELLSSIVHEALLSPRLNQVTDQLFIQPKSKILFGSLSCGFGLASKKFRTVLLREWFRLFIVNDVIDLQRAVNQCTNIKLMLSMDIAGFIRRAHFRS